MINPALRPNFQKKLIDYFFKVKTIVGFVLLACLTFFHYFQFFGQEALPILAALLVEMFLFLSYYFIRSRRPDEVLRFNLACLWIDVLAITVALHHAGGLYSLVWTGAYLMIVAIASVFLSRRGRISFAVYVLLAYSLLFHLEHSGLVARNLYRIHHSGNLDLFCWASTVALIFLTAVASNNLAEILGRYQAFANLGRLSTELAHEIRTPLQVIEGVVHREGCPESLRQEIHAQTERIANFLREIMAFGRQERQKISRVRVHDLVEYSVTLIFKAMPARQGIRLERNYCDEELWVQGDTDQLVKAFSNLVRNGLDSMNETGTLWVTISRYGFEWLQVEIRDDGAGIQKNEISRIFEPFYTTKTGRRGIGLGLAIARKFVEANSGRIEVESRPGQGSAFTVKLPLAAGPDPP